MSFMKTLIRIVMKTLIRIGYIMIIITSSFLIISPFIYEVPFGVHNGFAVFTFLLGLVCLLTD